MTDYDTPATDEVRSDYRPISWANYDPERDPDADAMFDRWLAVHDREVAAQALRDAADDRTSPASQTAYFTPEARQFLRDRADGIETGGET